MAYNPKWNVFNQIIEGDTRIAVADSGTSEALVVIDGVQVADFQSGGLALATGTRVNEFSIDGTLAGDSNTSIPTEQAVKTYVDTAISNLNPDKIWQDNSYVQVVDDGTNAGYVKMVTDGVEVVNVSDSEQTFGKTDSSHIVLSDSTASIPVGSVEAFGINENGIYVENGSTINEFSTDGTLGGNSNVALPTEQAVKTYVDTQIGSQSYKIFQGDSYIQVIDDGTAQSYAEVVINGTQVQYWDDAASTIRLGKASGAGRIVLNDTALQGYIGTTQIFNASELIQVFGKNGDTFVELLQAENGVNLVGGNVSALKVTDTIQRIGPLTSSNVIVDNTSNTITADANTTEVVNLTENVQSIGVSGDTLLTLTQNTNTVDLLAGNVSVFNVTDTTQRFGASGDTNLILNTSADTFTLSAGANTQVSGGLTSLTLGVAGDTTIALDQTTDQVAITAGGQSQLLIETQGVSVYEDLTVTGNLYVDGTTWVVHNQEVTTSDNVITLNYGEIGPGVTDGTAGIEIDRGTLTDYRFVFDEASDTFRVGEIGSLQAVATREDAPESMTVPWWNGTEFQYQTSGSAAITVNTTTDVIAFYAASAQVATFESDGLTLALGTNINEFSTDGTLAGDSDDAIPTEKAVKSYVDAQIGGSADKIFENNSKVEVVDPDATSVGYITIVADGTEIANFEESDIRIGPATTGARITVLDRASEIYVDSDRVLYITDTEQLMGFETGTHLATLQLTNEIEGVANNTTVLSMTDTTQTFGDATDTFIQVLQAGNQINASVNGTNAFLLDEASQRIGITTDSYLNINTSSNIVQIFAATSEVLNLQQNTQMLGVSADTNVTINQASNTVVLTAANATVATFSPNGLQLASGADVTEFSTDGTLAGASDDAVPTEQAVKTYVDTAIANLNADKIWEGDSYVEVVDDGTAAGYVAIVTDGVEVAHYDAQSSSQRMGKAANAHVTTNDTTIVGYIGATDYLNIAASSQMIGLSTDTNIQIVQATDQIAFTCGTTSSMNVNASGLQLNTGARVTEISTDTSLTDNSNTKLITQQAAKTYIDTEITALRNELDLINVKYVYSDTTAISGDVLLVDTTAGDVNIELLEAADSKVVIKKITGDNNNVIVTTTPGTIDGKASITIDTKYQAYHFVSDSVDFFIL